MGPLGGLIPSRTAFTCEGCHRLDPASGFFGTGGRASFEGITQIIKIPQLRNMYQKVGMFGSPKVDFFGAPDTGFMGDQVRGFGFVHDGAVDTLFRFFTAKVFAPQLTVGFPLINPDATRRDVVDFMMAIDSDLAPIVGQQVTLTATNATAKGAGRAGGLKFPAARPTSSVVPFSPTQESMKLKSTLVCVTGLAVAMALPGCASSRKTPFDAPRAATVIDVSSPDSGYAKVSQGVSAGVFGVLAGMKRHQDAGGTVSPAGIGPAVGGLVDDARVAVDDACGRVMVLEFADDGKRARIQTRCNVDFIVGQKVSVVRNLAGMDPRDILTVVPQP